MAELHVPPTTGRSIDEAGAVTVLAPAGLGPGQVLQRALWLANATAPIGHNWTTAHPSSAKQGSWPDAPYCCRHFGAATMERGSELSLQPLFPAAVVRDLRGRALESIFSRSCFSPLQIAKTRIQGLLCHALLSSPCRIHVRRIMVMSSVFVPSMQSTV